MQIPSIETYLKDLAEQGPLIFCPNAGNAGDSLIAHATFQLFERSNIPYQPYDSRRCDPSGKIMVYGGGGNLVPGDTPAWRFLERFHRTAKKLVVLPHTVCGHESLLASLGSNVDLIARERVSYDYLCKTATRANVFLTDDLAFGLDVAELLVAERSPFALLASRHLELKRKLRGARIWLRALKGSQNPVLNCFRTDCEKTGISLPADNADLSKIFKYGTATSRQAFLSTHMVFRFMNRFDEVRTNRLHMAIAGALLGKQVKFYPNNYYKCEAVYRFSLENRFPNVQWIGELE
ncbi:MAG: hypothetical protein RL346_451 [Verrucomicrobiota bacterium]|jgi:exopolysaccharide biosynthesis predicted pyruvyltransferase EpsI